MVKYYNYIIIAIVFSLIFSFEALSSDEAVKKLWEIDSIKISYESPTTPDGSFTGASFNNGLPNGWSGELQGAAMTLDNYDGNDFLKITTPKTESKIYPYIGYSPSSNWSGITVLELSLRIDTADNSYRKVEIKNSSGTIEELAYTKDNNIFVSYLDDTETKKSVSIGKYTLGQWNRLMFVADISSQRFDMYLNGRLVSEAKKTRLTSIRSLKLTVSNYCDEGITGFDNIALYTIKNRPRVSASFLVTASGEEHEPSLAALTSTDRIKLNFNNEMKAEDFTTENLLLKKGSEYLTDVPYSGLLGGNKKEYILNINEPMEPSLDYKLILKKNVRDINDAGMYEDKEIAFRTVPYILDVEKLSFYDMDNEIIYLRDRTTQSDLRVHLNMKNAASYEQSYIFIAVRYKGDKIQELQMSPETIPPLTDSKTTDLYLDMDNYEESDIVKAYVWYKEGLKPITLPEILEKEPKSRILFNSGFESGTIGVKTSDNSTEEGALGDLRGTDYSFSANNNWVTDLEGKEFGTFGIQYEGDTAKERFALLKSDPLNPDNQVLHFEAKEVIDAGKVRIQTCLYDNPHLEEVYYRFKMYFYPETEVLKEYPQSFGWFTISEFWNQPGWKELPYPFRTTLGIGKDEGISKDIYFKLDSQETAPYNTRQIWSVNNNVFAVPFGVWMDCEVYYRQGDENTGRFIFTVKPLNGERRVIFNEYKWTYAPANPSPESLTHFNPLKMYTSDELMEFVKNRSSALKIDWDDLELRESK